VKDEKKERELSEILTTIFSIATVISVCVIVLYLYKYRGTISNDHTRWAEFGDFIGGVLNPVFGFFGLFALLITISLQAKELKLTRIELKNSSDALLAQNTTLIVQNFENSFFQMLRLHNDIVNSIDFIRVTSNNSIVTSGRDCFPVMVKRLAWECKRMKCEIDDKECTIKAYEHFYEKHQIELGHYFRYIYNIFKFINESEVDNKKFYSNLVRAQISNYELVILFYNCLSKYGSEKFFPLAVKYSLIKNLPLSILLQENHRSWYPEKAYE